MRDTPSIRRERKRKDLSSPVTRPRSRRGFAAAGDPLFQREEGLRGPATFAIDAADKSRARARSAAESEINELFSCRTCPSRRSAS